MQRTERYGLIALTLMVASVAALVREYYRPIVTDHAAKPAAAARGDSLEANARGTMMVYCAGCHTAGRSGVEFDDAAMQPSAMRRDRATWELVVTKLRERTMPPRGFPQPSDADRQDLLRWITEVVGMGGSESTGPIMARRLLRAEYNNAVHDLFDMTFEPDVDLPPDDRGWDRYDDLPTLTESMKEQYRTAAAAIFDAALAEELANLGPSGCEEDDLKTAGPRQIAQTRHLFTCDGHGKTEVQCAREILASFAHHAYRRPIEPSEIDHLEAVFDQALKDGGSYEDGVRAALMEILTSPNFLFCIETRSAASQHPPSAAARDSVMLASRLALFLWRRMPDDELLRAAEAGLAPEHLEAQVRRMLRDRRSQALAVDFARQWLSLAKVNKNGRLDNSLARAMQLETEQFFAALIREDRSVLEFLDADYTFLNEPLARHYGIEGVYGEAMRRVRLSGKQRGGLLTQGSFLNLTADGIDTSPVRRGKWVLENLLAAAPIRPPLSVIEALQNSPKTFARGTLRQQLAQHRIDASCAECHARMDTIGLALENFGPTGAWRTEADGHPIEPAGLLPDGENMNDLADLKTYLLKHRKQFVLALSERLLAYALDRPLTVRDRAAFELAPDHVAAHGFHFSQVVLEVTQSDSFRAGWRGVDGK